MIPVFQTKFSSDNSKGNCLAACLASIMEFPLEEIPEFEKMSIGEWQEPMYKFLFEKRFDLEVHSKNLEHPKGFSIASGKSPRGNFRHSVVYFDGKLIHDPFPFGEGILSIDFFWTFTKI